MIPDLGRGWMGNRMGVEGGRLIEGNVWRLTDMNLLWMGCDVGCDYGKSMKFDEMSLMR